MSDTHDNQSSSAPEVDARIIRLSQLNKNSTSHHSSPKLPRNYGRARHSTSRAAEFIDRVRFNWVYVLSLLAVLTILSVNWWTASIIAGSEFSRFRITPVTALDPEPQKMTAADNAMIRIMTALDRQQQPGELALVFRQAEFAFYANEPFLYYLDNTLAHLYRTESVAELHRELLSLGIRFLVLPDYPRAEVENSHFEPLLADPTRTHLLYEYEDNRLFRLRDDAISTPNITLIEENFSENPEALSNWFLARTPPNLIETLASIVGTLDTAIITRDTQVGFVETRRTRSLRARPELFDILQRTPVQPQYSPFVIGEGDFDASLGTLRLEAEVEGDGYLEVVLAAYDREGIEIVEERQILWNGVLFDEGRRRIQAQFVDLAYDAEQADLPDQDRRHRIFFRLRDGGFLRLYEWSINHFPEITPTAQLLVERYRLPLSSGWTIVEGGLERRDLFLTEPDYDPDPTDAFEPVRFGRYDSRAVTLESPVWVVPSTLFDADIRRAVELYSSAIRPTLVVWTELAGSGAVRVAVNVECLQNSDDLVVTEPRNTENLVLGDLLLSRDTSRQELFTVELPCVPVSVRLLYTTMRNNLVVERDISLSYVDVLNVDVQLRFVDTDGAALQAPLHLTNELRQWRALQGQDFLGSGPETEIPTSSSDTGATGGRDEL